MKIGPIISKNPFEKLITDVTKDLGFELSEIKSRLIGQPDANLISYNNRNEFEIAVPGLVKSDISVSVKNNRLLIATKKEQLQTSKGNEGKYQFREFGFSGFERTFPLDPDSNIENISARCELGVLTITVPLKNSNLLNISID